MRRIIGSVRLRRADGATLALGAFVVCDQFVDRTQRPRRHVLRRPGDDARLGGRPVLPGPRAELLVETARELGIPVRDGGTVVAIQGPRFSTRAESTWFQALGWDVINMTAYPEGWLARELELCYANISMVTDHDVGVEGEEPVSHRDRSIDGLPARTTRSCASCCSR